MQLQQLWFVVALLLGGVVWSGVGCVSDAGLEYERDEALAELSEVEREALFYEALVAVEREERIVRHWDLVGVEEFMLIFNNAPYFKEVALVYLSAQRETDWLARSVIMMMKTLSFHEYAEFAERIYHFFDEGKVDEVLLENALADISFDAPLLRYYRHPRARALFKKVVEDERISSEMRIAMERRIAGETWENPGRIGYFFFYRWYHWRLGI